MTIQSLIKKFRTDSLTPEELKELRRLLDAADDRQIAGIIEDSPLSDETRADGEALRRVKRRIDRRILVETAANLPEKKERAEWLPRLYRIVTIAAAVIVPILFVAVVYLAAGNHGTAGSGETLLATQSLGKTDITLPDGTRVILRGDSRLWLPADFGENNRSVRLNGQAYFEVTQLKDLKEFIVRTPNMDIMVHGTVFSLTSREGSEYAEVSLEKGSVTVSTLSENIKLSPGETAILNRESGKLQVVPTSPDFQPNWDSDELTFTDVDPQTLIREIENAYNIRLAPSLKAKIDKNFTGTLPWNDLGLTLDALRYIYGFDLPYATTETD